MNNADKQLRYRTFIVSSSLVLLWLIIVAKLFSIQVIHNDKYQKRCREQADIRQVIKPLRGTIYDRNHKAMTLDIEKYSLAVHPYLVKKKMELATALSGQLHQPIDKYIRTLRSSKTFAWLEKDVPKNAVQPFLDEPTRYHGLVMERKIQRQYPFGEIGGQLIGLTDPDNKGLIGLELEFEKYLFGKAGWKMVQRDGWGRTQDRPDLPYQNSVDGSDLILTIDSEYQTILHEELKAVALNYEADKGMGIIIDPISGEIIAMATYPVFDPNYPAKFPTSSQRNCVITDMFEPGSTFKIAAATAALETGSVHPADSIDCLNGVIRVGGRTIHDSKKYQSLSFADVIKKSSNIGTIQVAQKIGKDVLLNFILRFGFGSRTGVQFPGEVAGIVQPLDSWNNLVLSQVAIGQGVAITTIQLAYAYAAIANGGMLLKPQIIKSITDRQGNIIFSGKPEYIRRVASRQTMATMREMLRLTVESGTATRANVLGMSIAGKTGTAQKVTEKGYSQTDFIATFVGFFPVKNPKLLCVIAIDNPKGHAHTGGHVSAPVVSEIFKRIVNQSDELFFHEEVMPTANTIVAEQADEISEEKPVVSTLKSARPATVLAASGAMTRMPNLKGKTSSEAILIARRLGLEIELNGSGIVVAQSPHVGLPVSLGSACKLTLKPKESRFD